MDQYKNEYLSLINDDDWTYCEKCNDEFLNDEKCDCEE
jgi:hypothetical protein